MAMSVVQILFSAPWSSCCPCWNRDCVCLQPMPPRFCLQRLKSQHTVAYEIGRYHIANIVRAVSSNLFLPHLLCREANLVSGIGWGIVRFHPRAQSSEAFWWEDSEDILWIGLNWDNQESHRGPEEASGVSTPPGVCLFKKIGLDSSQVPFALWPFTYKVIMP